MSSRSVTIMILVILSMALIPLTIGLENPNGAHVTQEVTSVPSPIDGDPQASDLMSTIDPLFTENLGQIADERNLYYAKGYPVSVALGIGWMSYDIRDPDDQTRGSHVRVSFEDSRPVRPVGVGTQGHRSNYFIGEDPSKWVSGARSFSQVRYPDLWEGIDLVYRFDEASLKYDLIVHPGADASSIRMVYEGHDDLSLDSSTGDLLVHTGAGELRDVAPVAFQGAKVSYEPIQCKFIVLDERTVGFVVRGYDTTLPLIIDPGVEFSTYLGGSESEHEPSVWVDTNGNPYVTGFTWSTNIPTTTGAYDMTHNDDYDTFVTKFKKDGSGLVYSTYVGGSGADWVTGITADDNGRALVTGRTDRPSNFPNTRNKGTLYMYGGDIDIFVVKLAADGSDLVFSAIIGGTLLDSAEDIHLDEYGDIVVGGYTASDGFPTTADAYDKTFGGYTDVLILKLDSAATKIKYASYLGGDSADWLTTSHLEKDGLLYFAVSSYSDDYPTYASDFKHGVQNHSSYLYISKFNITSSSLLWSATLGGEPNDRAHDITTDGDGIVYVTGRSTATDMPTTKGAYDTTHNGHPSDVFVCKFNPDGSDLSYFTYVGTDSYEGGSSIQVDPSGNAHVVGYTTGTDFPSTDPTYVQELFASNGFIFGLNPSGSNLLYSIFPGGKDCQPKDAYLDERGRVFIAGECHNDYVTTSGAYDQTHNGGWDAFLMRLKLDIVTDEAIDVPEGPVLFAGYKAYEFVVDLNPLRALEPPDGLTLVLDPEHAGVEVKAQLDVGEGLFSTPANPGDKVMLDEERCYLEVDQENGTILAHFFVWFNWTWGHEDPCDVTLVWRSGSPVIPNHTVEDLFNIEDDLAFEGALSVEGEWQGSRLAHDWVRSGENVTVRGPVVVYEGTTSTYPPMGVCKIQLEDNDGDTVVVGHASGEPIEMIISADGMTDKDELLTLSLVDLPGDASLSEGLSFPLGVDGDGPRFGGFLPSEDDWQTSSEVEIKVMVDDNDASGVDTETLQLSYYFEGMGGYSEWSSDDLDLIWAGFLLRAETVMTIPDSDGNLIRWKASDRVGNVASTEDLRILVDTHNITYTEPVPEENEWQSILTTTCGVMISDISGSGINVSSIQYRVSPRDLSQYGVWMDWEEGGQADAAVVVVRTEIEFTVSTLNHIQWRAMDIAGNGYTTSPHYRVLIDVIPIDFLDFEPTGEGFFNDSRIECSVRVMDGPDGSGVELSRLEYRSWTEEGFYSEWTSVGAEGIEADTRFSVILHMPDGDGNPVQFRGYDVAGNGPTESEEFTLSVDTEGPQYENYIPRPKVGSDYRRVEISTEIWDPLSGLDTTKLMYRHTTEEAGLVTDWTKVLAEDQGERYMIKLDLTLISGQHHRFSFRAFDMAGNEKHYNSHLLWVNTPPIAVITSPSSGGIFGEDDPILLSSNGSLDPDGPLAGVRWSVWRNGTTFVIDSEELVTSITLEPGNYTIKLMVKDGDRAEDWAEVTIKVIPIPPPEITPSEESNRYWLLLLIVIILVAAGAVYALMRKARREEIE